MSRIIFKNVLFRRSYQILENLIFR